MGASLCISHKPPSDATVAGGTILWESLPQTSVPMSVIPPMNQGTVGMQIPGCHPTPTESQARVWPKNLHFEEPPPPPSDLAARGMRRTAALQRVLWGVHFVALSPHLSRSCAAGPLSSEA